MRIIHIDLRSVSNDFVELRYGYENLNEFEPRRLAIAQIQDVIDLVERDYAVSLPVDYAKTGRRLYEWLDGSDRLLSSLICSEAAVLAIATGERLAHLPWEILHDGQRFLVARPRPVVPVRWQAQGADERLIWQQPGQQSDKDGYAVPNRPLQMLFMATSPVGVEPVLDFEKEEGQILAATEQQPLSLVVEESGCLTELANLLASYGRDEAGRDYFDVVHLSGHAWLGEEGPRFITETETGDRFDASAEEIAEAFEFRFPALVFLSGCRTGESGGSGEVPSMAAALLAEGAQAVLGWGRPVRDVDGILAAQTLYSKLSAAKTLLEALALTYRAMIRENARDRRKARDWHLLRLYVSGVMPQNLVTPLKTPGRAPEPVASMAETFLDAEGRVKVVDRRSFVGRRRPLQNCLRALRDRNKTGVLLYGMGGLGKSTLAARLCDRLIQFERVVLFGALDEAALVNKLADKIGEPDLRRRVQNPDEELKYRLRDLFRAQAKPAFLLVLDDFEANLEASVSEGFRIKETPARVLGALLWAIEEVQQRHRVLMTCRYDFEFGGMGQPFQKMYKQPLAGLQQADLNKKCRQLEAFGENSTIEKGLRERALRLADGNPRLLEWLDKVLRHPEEINESSISAVLDKLEEEPVQLREKVLAEVLIQQIDQSMKEMLERTLLYELPVPKEAIHIICEGISGIETSIDKAIALGLLEKGWDEALRVPRILPLQLSCDEKLARQAANLLTDIWLRKDEIEGIKALEVHRIAMYGKEQKLATETAMTLSQSWMMRGSPRKAIDICETTLSITDHPRLLMNIVIAKNTLGFAEEAYSLSQNLLEILKTSPVCEKESNMCTYIRYEVNNLLSDMKDRQGKTEQALAGYLKSLVISGRLKSKEIKADAYRKVAGAYTDLGKLDKAFDSYDKALFLLKDDDQSLKKGAVLHDIAKLYFSIGKLNDAVSFFKLALESFDRTKNSSGYHATLHELGRVLIQKGEYSKALAIFDRCLSFFESAGDIRAKAQTLHEIGFVLIRQGSVKAAIPKLKEVLSLETDLKDSCSIVTTLNTLASAYLALNFVKISLKYAEKSLKLFENIPECFAPKAETFSILAAIYLFQGLEENAISAFHSAREYYQKAGNEVGVAATLASIGNTLYRHFKRTNEALKYLEASFMILDRLESPEKEGVMKTILLIEEQNDKRS